jgi:hypothetical protein
MNLTREQAAIVSAKIGPMLGYQVRLRMRMDKVGFLPGDPLYRLVRGWGGEEAGLALMHLEKVPNSLNVSRTDSHAFDFFGSEPSNSNPFDATIRLGSQSEHVYLVIKLAGKILDQMRAIGSWNGFVWQLR